MSKDDAAAPTPLPGLQAAPGEQNRAERRRAHLLLGAPGTGRTHELIERAAAHLQEGGSAGEILLLAPTRLAADRLRNLFSRRIAATVSSPPARAWHSYAFDLLRRAHAEQLLPGVHFQPRLLAGPEQDVLIGQLLEAHARGIGRAPDWPTDLQEALGTRGFRREIREFLDRCAEYGLSPQQVRELARENNQQARSAAADFAEEYEQIRRLRMPQAYDPSALIHEAALFLEEHPDFLAAEHQRLRLILVDDLQEATPAVMRLLGALFPAEAADPPQLVLSACTDTVVQGFRGARPQQLAELEARLPGLGGVEAVPLERGRRMSAQIQQVWERVAERIPVVARARHSRRPEPTEGQGEVRVHLVDSEQQQLRLLSQEILEEHVREGRPYEEMAVIVREGSMLGQLKRHLEQDGIPVRLPVAETPLREEPAVRPFLDALWLIADTHGAAGDPGGTRALSLLTSRLGGASPSSLRRIRQRLRAEELRAGGRRGSDELLLRALGVPSAQAQDQGPAQEADMATVEDLATESELTENAPPAEDLPERDLPESAVRGGALGRIRAVLAAGRAAQEEPGATAETVLWAVWQASGLEREWAAQSENGGPGAQRADRDLDAMVELFKSAERYCDQQPGAGILEFLEYLDAQDLPMDTLAPSGGADSAVSLLTPASAAGREWPWVHIAGLQQGRWPNTTVRGGLLGTTALTEILTLGAEAAAQQTHRGRVKEIRVDELRMFSTAVSRASQRLTLSAVLTEEDDPSEFLDLIDPQRLAAGELTTVRRPMTLRGLTAELRRAAQTDPQAEPQPEHPEGQKAGSLADPAAAAAQLARLAEAGVPGAAPEDWWGLLPLSEHAEALDPHQPVPLSPSRLEGITRSPLDWFVSASGAEAATDLSRSLGTLIHEIAQDMPDAPGLELERALEERFPRLGLDPQLWQTQQEYERARGMIRRFAAYTAELSSQHGRRLIGVEGSFSVLIPGPARTALLQGRVDRLEVDDAGRYVIVDLKTGKTKPSKDAVAQNPQLASYQVAVSAGAGAAMQEESQGEDPKQDQNARPQPLELLELTEMSGGAVLIQLGTATKSYGHQLQNALTPEDQWAVELIQRCAQLIAHRRFQARHDAAAESGFGYGCRLPEICPLCSAGRQVTQP